MRPPWTILPSQQTPPLLTMKRRNCTERPTTRIQDEEGEEAKSSLRVTRASVGTSNVRPSTAREYRRHSTSVRRRRWRKFAVDKKAYVLPVANICAKTWAPLQTSGISTGIIPPSFTSTQVLNRGMIAELGHRQRDPYSIDGRCAEINKVGSKNATR